MKKKRYLEYKNKIINFKKDDSILQLPGIQKQTNKHQKDKKKISIIHVLQDLHNFPQTRMGMIEVKEGPGQGKRSRNKAQGKRKGIEGERMKSRKKTSLDRHGGLVSKHSETKIQNRKVDIEKKE